MTEMRKNIIKANLKKFAKIGQKSPNLIFGQGNEKQLLLEAKLATIELQRRSSLGKLFKG